jgi:hypothetical protein
MFDFIGRYISAISLAVVAALSIFNIGYFWKIGLHFIGLVDLTNLVYSAGLALAAISVLIMSALIVVPKRPDSWKLVVTGIVGTALSTWGILRFNPRTLDPQLCENGAILVGFGIAGSAALIWALQRNRLTGVWNWRDLVLFPFALCATTFQVGVFTAALELSDRRTYTVMTKSGGELQDTRILRSASAGFILAIDGHVVFVPQREIISVKSSEPK